MDENDFTLVREHKVRVSGQVSTMQAIPIAHAVDKPTHGQLRVRVFVSDPAHSLASLLGRERIHRSPRFGGDHHSTVLIGRRAPRHERRAFRSPHVIGDAAPTSERSKDLDRKRLVQTGA